MASEAIHKLEPHRVMYLRGFDRRGAAASLNNASAAGWTVSGAWSDQADFAVLVLHDADDQFGHLFTTRYLPSFSLHGVTLDFDLAVTNAMCMASRKYQSVPWGALSYITAAEVPGTIALLPLATSAPGMAAASATFTVNGATAPFDRVQLTYLSNLGFEFIVPGGLSGSATYFFAAKGSSPSFTVDGHTFSYTVTAAGGDSGSTVAGRLAGLANGWHGVSCSSSSNVINFTSGINTGAVVNVQGFQLWMITDPPATYIAAQLAAQINGVNWNSIGPTIALMATASGSTLTVTAARYGTVNTSGTAVTLAGGYNFLGSNAGDAIVIAGVTYAIATVNSTTSVTLTASAGTQTGAAYLAPGAGLDGNSISLQERHLTGTTYLTPAGTTKLTGGTDPTSLHFHVDFTASGIDSVRQLWLTFAPALNYDSGAVNPTLVAYQAAEWSAVATNWTLADPTGVLPLQVAGPGSVTVGSRDGWARYAGTGWSEQAGFYHRGFAHVSATAGDQTLVTYSCQHTHDLYAGTSLTASGGQFTTTLDGVAQTTVECYADTGSPIAARRLIASGVAAGTHTVGLTVSATSNASSTGANCYFDFLQAAVAADVQDPPTTFATVNAACDYDTPQTYALSPSRAFWILSRMGFQGDIDFYAGVFFAHKRVRFGGSFHSAVVTISAGANGFNLGTGFGDGDAMFLQLGGTSYGDPNGTAFGAAVFVTDTVDTLAQRFVNAVNTLFVGIRAVKTGTGQLTITTLGAVAGFTLYSQFVAGTGAQGFNPSTGSMTVAGDVQVGNEGVWQIDATQANPLNRAFTDYLADFAGLVHAAGQTMTVAFSQELLAPPDANTAAGAWGQRYADGTQVLTSTGFGSWGAGVVEAVSGSGTVTIQQTGHGYITGNTVHIASAVHSGVWAVTVVDADHYQIAVTGSYTPGVGDSSYIDLQTTQCAFNASTVTPYMAAVFSQAAGVLNSAGLVPWLQFGEILHWFFSEKMSVPISGLSNAGGVIEFATTSAHGLTTGQTAVVAGAPDGNGTLAVTVVDATHFTNGSAWHGPYGASGTVSGGGGMAFYDASQTAAALTALGTALPQFWTQDDDPSGNAAAVAWLAGRIKTHLDTIRNTVLAAHGNAKFELLWPNDVNFATCYYTAAVPYPQGGRLNAAVNLPAAYLAKSGSGLDRLKMEALSWGATYRNLTNAVATIQFPPKPGWPAGSTAYLIPVFNGGCPWPAEYLAWQASGMPLANFWAVDHLTLFSWPLSPAPSQGRGAGIV